MMCDRVYFFMCWEMGTAVGVSLSAVCLHVLDMVPRVCNAWDSECTANVDVCVWHLGIAMSIPFVCLWNTWYMLCLCSYVCVSCVWCLGVAVCGRQCCAHFYCNVCACV